MRLLLAAAIAFAPLLAHADNKAEAQKHLAAAGAAYKEKRWQDVLDELGKAYALDPKPELHFSIGQVYVKMGRCPDAIVAYEQFLATKPNAENAAIAKEAIDTCKATMAKPPESRPVEPKLEKTPPPKGETPSNIRQPPPKETPGGDRWYQDKLGLALVGGGGALIAGGVVTYVLARGTLGDAEDAATYDEQVDLYDSARTKRTISVVLVVGGLAAAGAGVWHYAKKQPAERRAVSVVPLHDGGFVTYGGSF